MVRLEAVDKLTMCWLGRLSPGCDLEEVKSFEEAIRYQDHARGSKTLAAWSMCYLMKSASKRNFLKFMLHR